MHVGLALLVRLWRAGHENVREALQAAKPIRASCRPLADSWTACIHTSRKAILFGSLRFRVFQSL